ncbi:MAG: 2,3-bisphosphoglycerate-independent phosphoglycerate mutase [Rikenellaceae bacterium]
MNSKVLLMILDGWGKGDQSKSDAIYSNKPEFINSLMANYPNSELRTDGENVGLPDGQMGNSEVGHQNIGAGRILFQDLVKINRTIKDNALGQNPEIKAALDYAKEKGVKVHFLGLASNGGVHSSLEHLYALTNLCKEWGLEKVYTHCFMDGRDTDPKSGKGFLEEIEAKAFGKIATVVGRYYAMDRDKRWERVKKAYDLLVGGVGVEATSAAEAIQASYDNGVTDEFIDPIILEKEGTIAEGDVVIFYNFRNDRAKELTIVLTQTDIEEEGMKTLPLYYCTMTPYDSSFKGLHILFDKENVQNTLGEYISSKGLCQLRIAETEKFAHVTFFFNGGREVAFEGESRILVASPKVATYDLQPEMSAPEITEKLVAELNKGEEDFVCLNFANGDMVGHTGIYEAISKAVKTIDSCVKEVVEAARANGYTVLITADHGNADNAVNADGSPNTAHSLNPVPFIVVSDEIKAVRSGVLADIAPTVLTIMGLEVPADMTGKSLVD